MSLTKLAVAAATLTFLAGSAMAATNVLGTWKGTLKINTSKLPPATSPQMKQMIDSQVAMVSKLSFSLVLSKDGTFSIKTAGLPAAAGAPSKAETGTWTLKGDQLSLTSPKDKAHAKSFTVAKDGKSFFAEEQQGVAVLTFKR